MNIDINNKLLDKIKQKKAIIWDFDGVLCFYNWSFGEDFNKWWFRLWDLLEKFDPHIREKYKGKLEHVTDLPYPYEHTDYVANKYGRAASQKINAFYLEKELLILPVSSMNLPLFKIIKNTSTSTEHFIWSNNQGVPIKKALDDGGILHAFKSIVSKDMIQKAKPHLDGFTIIQSHTTVLMNAFLFVGDSFTDKVIADKLGMEFFYYK